MQMRDYFGCLCRAIPHGGVPTVISNRWFSNGSNYEGSTDLYDGLATRKSRKTIQVRYSWGDCYEEP